MFEVYATALDNDAFAASFDDLMKIRDKAAAKIVPTKRRRKTKSNTK